MEMPVKSAPCYIGTDAQLFYGNITKGLFLQQRKQSFGE